MGNAEESNIYIVFGGSNHYSILRAASPESAVRMTAEQLDNGSRSQFEVYEAQALGTYRTIPKNEFTVEKV